jgi:hypothetical protein
VAESSSNRDLHEELFEFSRLYRAIITAQVFQLQDAASQHPKDAKENLNQSKLYQITNLVWHFAEIFFISTRQNVILELIECYNLHWENKNLQILKEIEGSSKPEAHPQYWRLLYRYSYSF